MSHPNLLSGIEHSDDAGVYRLTDDLALIQTLDFFTPIVDEPYTFGQVAAANALSDVYAMGGTPLTAMNIVCFPINDMDISILREILRGGIDKLREAETLLVGGHSVDDREIKYGLSVTGIVHPKDVLLNRGARPGDILVLTKPLGTGIINTALKAGMASDEQVNKSINVMTSLNKTASLIMKEFTIHACTDITGFGLLGHACEMIEESEAGIIIEAFRVPLLPDLKEFVEMGVLPGGLHRNRNFRKYMVKQEPGCPDWLMDIFFDPQTSGGLLVAVEGKDADRLVKGLQEEGIEEAAAIGAVTADEPGTIIVK